MADSMLLQTENNALNPTQIYLSHLSFSNLLLSIATPFLAAYYAQGSVWPWGSVLCQLMLSVPPVIYMNIYLGVIIPTWVALSRSTLIQHTHASRLSACTTLLPNTFFICLRRATFVHRVCATVWVVVRRRGGGGVLQPSNGEWGGSVSIACNVAGIILFFVCFLMVLLSYMTVVQHTRRSRRSANITDSRSLLPRVFCNIVVIQVAMN
ncbi:LOW QUALITY PROTEIN: putative G-protein coupled receptor 82 [Diretmus argenteus]